MEWGPRTGMDEAGVDPSPSLGGRLGGGWEGAGRVWEGELGEEEGREGGGTGEEGSRGMG